MNIEYLPLISFVLITTFTPGPNNLSSASMGILYGYRRTFPFLAGICSGFFIVMLICAVLSSTLLTLLPSAEKFLRFCGAGYILWLAMGTLKAGESLTGQKRPAAGFAGGLMLQLLNPKVMVYGLTLYSTFLAPASGRLVFLAVSAACFALTALTSISTWALCGSAIKNRLKNDRFRKGINLVLALLLAYTAVELSGILG